MRKSSVEWVRADGPCVRRAQKAKKTSFPIEKISLHFAKFSLNHEIVLIYIFFSVCKKKEAKRRRKSEKTSIGKMDFHRQKTFKGKLKSTLRHFKATPSVKISSSKWIFLRSPPHRFESFVVIGKSSSLLFSLFHLVRENRYNSFPSPFINLLFPEGGKVESGSASGSEN